MNGINYILDTNAIIYLLSGNPVSKIKELNLELINPSL